MPWSARPVSRLRVVGSPAMGVTRVIRTVVLASVVLVLSCLAHVVAGGVLPGWPVLVVLGLLVSAECAVVTRRRLSSVPVFAVMAIGQLVLHELLMTFSAAPATMIATAPIAAGVRTGADHAAGIAASTGMQPGMVGVPGGSGRMLTCHLVATAVLACLVAFGEDALWRLWCWLAPVTLRVSWPSRSVHRSGVARPARGVLAPSVALRLSLDTRRGPPLPVSV